MQPITLAELLRKRSKGYKLRFRSLELCNLLYGIREVKESWGVTNVFAHFEPAEKKPWTLLWLTSTTKKKKRSMSR